MANIQNIASLPQAMTGVPLPSSTTPGAAASVAGDWQAQLGCALGGTATDATAAGTGKAEDAALPVTAEAADSGEQGGFLARLVQTLRDLLTQAAAGAKDAAAEDGADAAGTAVQGDAVTAGGTTLDKGAVLTALAGKLGLKLDAAAEEVQAKLKELEGSDGSKLLAAMTSLALELLGGKLQQVLGESKAAASVKDSDVSQAAVKAPAEAIQAGVPELAGNEVAAKGTAKASAKPQAAEQATKTVEVKATEAVAAPAEPTVNGKAAASPETSQVVSAPVAGAAPEAALLAAEQVAGTQVKAAAQAATAKVQPVQAPATQQEKAPMQETKPVALKPAVAVPAAAKIAAGLLGAQFKPEQSAQPASMISTVLPGLGRVEISLSPQPGTAETSAKPESSSVQTLEVKLGAPGAPQQSVQLSVVLPASNPGAELARLLQGQTLSSPVTGSKAQAVSSGSAATSSEAETLPQQPVTLNAVADAHDSQAQPVMDGQVLTEAPVKQEARATAAKAVTTKVADEQAAAKTPLILAEQAQGGGAKGGSEQGAGSQQQAQSQLQAKLERALKPGSKDSSEVEHAAGELDLPRSTVSSVKGSSQPESGTMPQGLAQTAGPQGSVAGPQALPLWLAQFSAPANSPVYGGTTSLSAQRLALQLGNIAHEAQQAQADVMHTQIQLDPPSLGRIQVNLAVQGNAVALQISSNNPLARRELRDSLAAIKQSLTEAGLQITDIEVVGQANPAGTADEDGAGSHNAPQEQDRLDVSATDRLAGPELLGLQQAWQGLMMQQLAGQAA